MNILIYGSGVIGSVYAVNFTKAGNAVSVLARGARLAELREGGLRIRNVFLGDSEEAPVEILERLPEGKVFNLVLVAVRSGQIIAALKELAQAVTAEVVLVVGNNLEDHAEELAVAGEKHLVLGFGAFGGYREDGVVFYTDGRTKERPEPKHRSKTTIGGLTPSSQAAMERVKTLFLPAGLPLSESDTIRAWLICHAALVFPLAGAIYAAGGDQGRTCRTRDALILSIRACKELIGALRTLGIQVEPDSLKKLLATPEWLLVGILRKALTGEGARVAMFGHANAAPGRSEISGQAKVLDDIVQGAGRPLPNWARLLPYFDATKEEDYLPDSSRKLRYRVW